MTTQEKPCVWPNLVEQSSGGRFCPINEGKGGRPTDSLGEFREALEKHRGAYDLLVLALGGNDARDISGACVPNAVKNVREMVRLALEDRASLPILIVAPANIRKDTLGPTRLIANERDQNLRGLGKAYEVLARELACHFVSLYGVIPPEALAIDGVHPNAQGNEPIAHCMLETLERVVGNR